MVTDRCHVAQAVEAQLNRSPGAIGLSGHSSFGIIGKGDLPAGKSSQGDQLAGPVVLPKLPPSDRIGCLEQPTIPVVATSPDSPCGSDLLNGQSSRRKPVPVLPAPAIHHPHPTVPVFKPLSTADLVRELEDAPGLVIAEGDNGFTGLFYLLEERPGRRPTPEAVPVNSAVRSLDTPQFPGGAILVPPERPVRGGGGNNPTPATDAHIDPAAEAVGDRESVPAPVEPIACTVAVETSGKPPLSVVLIAHAIRRAAQDSAVAP